VNSASFSPLDVVRIARQGAVYCYEGAWRGLPGECPGRSSGASGSDQRHDRRILPDERPAYIISTVDVPSAWLNLSGLALVWSIGPGWILLPFRIALRSKGCRSIQTGSLSTHSRMMDRV
jgi:hypothetical protein